MKFAHFATYDLKGGAAKASYRLHTLLREAGHDSRMFVRRKLTNDAGVTAIPVSRRRYRLHRATRWIRYFWGRTASLRFDFNFDQDSLLDRKALLSLDPADVDVLCFCQITSFMTVADIRAVCDHCRAPTLFVMVDQELVTGGCHYARGCDGYTRRCGNCPQLTPAGSRDRSRKLWERKARWLSCLPSVIVCPTGWALRKVRESSLFRDARTAEIALAIDTSVFRPFDRAAARDLLHVPRDKKVLLFAAPVLDDPRKGATYLVEALQRLRAMTSERTNPAASDLYLLVAGLHAERILESLPFPSRCLGHLADDISLALAYQAADVFICPSVEDGGPMMIPEAMLSGTPVVSFDVGGAPDLVETMQTGYRCSRISGEALAEGVRQMFSCGRLAEIGRHACERARAKHSPEVVLASYVALCEELLATRSQHRGTST